MLNKLNYGADMNVLENMDVVCDDMVDRIADTSSYVNFYDLALELAGENVPVYYSELADGCYYLAEYADQAMEEGLVGTSATIMERLSVGAELYIRELLEDNLYEILFNASLKYLEEHHSDLINLIDAKDLEEMLEEFGNMEDNQQLEDRIEDMLEGLFLLDFDE